MASFKSDLNSIQTRATPRVYKVLYRVVGFFVMIFSELFFGEFEIKIPKRVSKPLRIGKSPSHK